MLGDLCGQLIPGNRVTVCGTLLLKKVKSDAGLIFEPYIKCNSIIVNNESYDEIEITDEDLSKIIALSKTPNILNTLSSSIAPTVYGNEEVKQGITLQIFGGIPKTISGTRIRGDIHVLLIGDPGIAKSVIMKHAVGLLPRGIFTHGYSSSKAGLTATAVKEEEGWVLEAGALVLANGGMCAVDELDKMNDNDREALHGAMEQQEIDIAKAGIVAKLYTRCSLLAAANPKLGRFDLCTALSSQFNLAPTLLSRFDLIYPLTDVPEVGRDAAIADYILNTHVTQKVVELIPNDLFRKYIAHARTINPRLSPEAAGMIKEYYTKVRGMANNMHTVPITARSLEALIRLCEASARMRLSETVTPDDAKVVITIVDGCLKKIAYDSKTNTWDIDKIVNRYSKRTANVVGKITDSIINVRDDKGVAAITDIVSYMKQHYNVEEEEVTSTIELLQRETRLLSPKNGYVKLFK
jgi:replicative DNA helicase Mcm